MSQLEKDLRTLGVLNTVICTCLVAVSVISTALFILSLGRMLP